MSNEGSSWIMTSILHTCLFFESYSLVFFGTADINQERIVEEGGLDALLSLLETSENTTIYRVTAGAVANLAMNGNVFQQSTLQISHIWSRCTNNHLLAHCQNF